MALFDIEFPEDFLSGLLDTEFGEIAEEALNEAAPMLEASMKKECSSVIEHDGDSEMVNSIKAGKPKRTKTDAYIVNVSPKGYSNMKKYTAKYKGKKTSRKYAVSNALKCIWKEYGIPGRQPPRPFLDRSCNNVRESVMSKMQEVYNRKVDAE